jgi:hypothetical protein
MEVIMQTSNEYATRAWILKDLRQHLTTDELDEVILFARRAGYLDADAQLTDAGTRYFNLMTKYKKELETI